MGDSSSTALCVLAMVVPGSMVEAYPQPTVRRWPGFSHFIALVTLAPPPSCLVNLGHTVFGPTVQRYLY